MFKEYLGRGEILYKSVNSLNLLCDVSNRDHYTALGLNVVLDFSNPLATKKLDIAHGVSLNVVQDSEYFVTIAKYMEENYGIPYLLLKVENMGIDDLIANLTAVADFFCLTNYGKKIDEVVELELNTIIPKLIKYRTYLDGKTASLFTINKYVLGALEKIGMEVKPFDFESEIIIADSEYETLAIKIETCFYDIKMVNSLKSKGYYGLINLYHGIYEALIGSSKLIHICHNFREKHTNMYLSPNDLQVSLIS